MYIINVVSLKSGLISEIKSFPILITDNEKEIVKQAEDYFVDRVKSVSGCEDYSLTDAEEVDFIFDDQNGNEVVIIWSE